MTELFNIGFISFTLFDLLDIVLITIIFYWVYKALKGTLAIQVMFGFGIIMGLALIAEAINLKSINWLLRLLSDIWILAFVILFQPEIRKMLLQLTQSPLFYIFIKNSTVISERIDEVIDAALDMSIQRIGALIVLQQTQDVEMAAIDGGIELNAAVKKELIISIFNTKSPLHDGALIITKKMEIVSARCILPLSDKKQVGKRLLGTRHRAGLGLTEKIDAVVLIVSEETGWISIASGGNLQLDIPADKLKETLINKLTENKSLENKLTSHT